MGLRESAADILASVRSTAGVQDALIATRDGLPALGELRDGDVDTIAAMAAASLAAAETVSLETGSGRVKHLSAGCDGAEILFGGLDDQYLLILIADPSDGARTAFENAHQALQTVLAE